MEIPNLVAAYIKNQSLKILLVSDLENYLLSRLQMSVKMVELFGNASVIVEPCVMFSFHYYLMDTLLLVDVYRRRL